MQRVESDVRTPVTRLVHLVSQDTLSSLFPIASLSKYYYSGIVTRCSTSDVYGTGVDTTVDAAVSTVVRIVFNTVRAERSETPTPYDTSKCPATRVSRRTTDRALNDGCELGSTCRARPRCRWCGRPTSTGFARTAAAKQRPLQLEGCRCVGALAIATATTFLVRAGPWPGAVRAALWRLRLRADEEKSRLKPKFGQDTSSD